MLCAYAARSYRNRLKEKRWTFMKWTRETASNELDLLIKEVESLKTVRHLSASHVRWMIRVRTFLEQLFGQNSSFFNSFVAIEWNHSGSFLMHALDDLE